MNLINSAISSDLDQYVAAFASQEPTEAYADSIRRALGEITESSAFDQVAREIWDKYSVVEVDLMILILRRWVTIAPESKDAKRVLGHYLLCHGPDWDHEAQVLLQQSNE